MKRSLVLVVLLIAAVSAGALLLMERERGGEALDRSPVALAPGSSDAEELEAMGKKPEGVDGAAAAAAGVESPGPRRGALELSGTVIPADGGPLGEPLRVQARWFSGWEERMSQLEVPVGGDGTFALGLPAGRQEIELRVLGEFLALAKPTVWEPGRDGPIELRPQRGGCLVVDLAGPAAGDPEARPGEEFQLVARSATAGATVRREAFLGTDGALRIGGLPEGRAWRLRLTAAWFVDAEVPAPRVGLRERSVVELPLSRGCGATGVVLGDQGGPVSAAEVRLSSWRHGDARRQLGREESVTTDAKGRFAVGGILPGELTLRVAGEGYLRHTEELGEQADGALVEDIQVRLAGGGAVQGMVLWPDGKPAAKATVVVKAPGQSWKSGESMKTEADGSFAFTGLKGSSFQVLATLKKRKAKHQGVATASAAGGETIELVLGEGLGLAGQVQDSTGAGLGAFRVEATPLGVTAGAGLVSQRIDGDDGRFELRGLLPGSWELRATAKGYGTGMSARVELPGADGVVLVLPAKGSLAGRVVDRTQAPVGPAKIRSGTRRADVDAEGRFLLEGLSPGLLDLVVSAEGFGPVVSEPLVLRPGEERSGVTVVLSTGSRVLGEIHPSGFRGDEFQVSLRLDGVFEAQSTDVDEEGRFRFEGLEPGSYWVSFSSRNQSDWVEGHRLARPVPVEVPEEGDVRVVLGDPGDYPLRLSGEVRKAGKPTDGLLLYAYREGGDRHYPVALARTADGGTYELLLRESGTYIVSAGEGQMRLSRYFVEVSSQPQQRRDFDLPSGQVSGRAVRENGSPAVGRMCVLMHADAPRDSIMGGDLQLANTGSNGAFLFEDVLPGSYHLRSGNYLSPHPTDGLVIVEEVVVPEEGSPDPIELVIPQGAIVDVTAQDSQGEPLPGCRIELSTAAGHLSHLYNVRETGYSGQLRFTGVGAGPQTARVFDRDGRQIGQATVEARAGEQVELLVSCDP